MNHHELNTTEFTEEKQHFLPETLRKARTFARFPIAIPSSYHLFLTGHVQTHEKIFELHLATTNVPYQLRLNRIEHLLFDTITLHKLMKRFDHENVTDRECRSRVVLGCMIQHRLTKLLIEVHPQEYNQIYQLGHAGGIDQHLWETYFVGAASCARTICTFLETKQGRVFLPSVFEDCMLGIDLIVLDHKRNNWCVSIKAGRHNTPLIVEHVHTRPHDRDPSYRSDDRRRIFDGSRSMEDLYKGTFHACRIVVGRTNGSAYDMTVYEEDTKCLRHFIEKDRSQPPFIRHMQGLASNEQLQITDAA